MYQLINFSIWDDLTESAGHEYARGSKGSDLQAVIQ